MEGAFEQAKASDLSLMVLKAHGPQAKIETLVRLREEERVDGAIMLLSEMSNGILDAIGGHYENLVIINKDIDHLRLDNVFIDNVAAGFEAVKHMIDVNGFERLIFVGGSTSSVDGFDRKQGFNNALADAGMEADMPVF
jgi:LacI family transcriptional regulator